MDHAKHRKFAIKISILCLLPMAWIPLPILVFFTSFKTSRPMMFSSIYQLLHNLFYVCQFSCATLALKARFTILNNYLETFITSSSFNVKTVAARQEIVDLRLFSELYSKLCDILQSLNSIFTLHLVIVMLNFMTIEIFGGYGIIREVLLPKRNAMNMIASFVWISSHFPIKFFMAYSGSSTTAEAEKALVLITKIIISTGDHNTQYKNALNISLHQLQIREKRLSNIFFNIDYNIILAVRLN